MLDIETVEALMEVVDENNRNDILIEEIVKENMALREEIAKLKKENIYVS